MSRHNSDDIWPISFSIFMIVFSITCLVAWVNHIIWIIGKLASDTGATVGQMVLGALGAFMPPVGVIHGFMLFFGVGL